MQNDRTIYLDNAATTKADSEAVELMAKYSTELFYNPSALYEPASKVLKDLNDAAFRLAKIINARSSEVVFTSSATESNNYAIKCGHKNKKGKLIISAGEHASVYEAALEQKSIGRTVEIIPIKPSGMIDKEKLLAAAKDNAAMVSVLHCSNETGVINDIENLAREIKKIDNKIVFHSDGVQAFCKVKFDFHNSLIDLYSVSAHKIGGLKGVGALFIKDDFNLKPYIVGGGQQGNRRSGTENVGGIISFAAAAEKYAASAKNFNAHILRDYLIAEIQSHCSDIEVNGHIGVVKSSRDGKASSRDVEISSHSNIETRSHSKVEMNGYCDIEASGHSDVEADGAVKNSGYILSISSPMIKGETVSSILSRKGIFVGLGSACSSHAKKSRILQEMGRDNNMSEGTIRISFCPKNNFEEIEIAAREIVAAINEYKSSVNIRKK